jgi:putative peptide zinc metalloprotease protein
MTATARPPAAPPPVEDEPVLDRAAGVELLGDVHGSGYREGAALVRRPDGQMVQLGPLMYALLESVDGRRSRAELADALCERLGRACTEEHVAALAEKLAAQGLLAGSEHNAPPRRNPLLALRWKVLITNPRVTDMLTAPFTFLFRPFVVWPVVAAFAVVCWFVLFHKGLGAATADAFDRPGLLLLVFALTVASAAFHEIGHAAACRYGGARPGGMGAGLYLVWPAFYTDVTDAYRLPRRDRLRVDLGGIYFNALVSVATAAVWFAWRADALLLLVGLQLLMMVKNLSPVIRSDGYHILADATGVPDLYAHIGPTLRRLLPWRPAEPSALKGRARALVTVWVLVVVPVLLSLMLGAVVLLPRLLTSAWDSGRHIADEIPHQGPLGIGASVLRLLALFLPVVGSTLVTQRIVRVLVRKGRAWSAGSLPRTTAVGLAAAGACAVTAWALWPSGQYQPVRYSDRGTIVSLANVAAAPRAAVRPSPLVQRAQIAPGTHLAVAMIPVGGATKKHPAYFFVRGDRNDPPVVLVSDGTSAQPAPATSTTAAGTTSTAAATTTTTAATTTTQPTTTTASGGDSSSAPVAATAFPFALPSKPGPGDSQALATNTRNGGVTYDVAYSLVTVTNGAPVTNRNSAYALAHCQSCTTVAVSFQVVLVVGQSNVVVPVNTAAAVNYDCPACVTTAIADQIVVTLKSKPSQQVVTELHDALAKLDALPKLGAGGTPAAVAAEVGAVQQQIETVLDQSGLLAKPRTTSSTSTSTSSSSTSTSASTSSSTTARSTSTAATTTAPAAGPAPTSTGSATTTTTTTAPTTSTAATATTTTTTTTAPTTTTDATSTPTTTAATTTAG